MKRSTLYCRTIKEILNTLAIKNTICQKLLKSKYWNSKNRHKTEKDIMPEERSAKRYDFFSLVFKDLN
jgi:hypothetical protein